jgi:hypothetical protein
VHRYTTDAHNIATFASVNSFLSSTSRASPFSPSLLSHRLSTDVVLLGCTNRAVEVLDAAVGRPVCVFADAHARPVHGIAMAAAAGAACSHPQSLVTKLESWLLLLLLWIYLCGAKQMEVFATTAPDSTVRLWDMRSRRSVVCDLRLVLNSRCGFYLPGVHSR